MKKSFILGLLALPFIVNAQAKFDLKKPMEFIDVNPCIGTSTYCSPFVMAQGTITKETPDKLDELMKKNPFSKIGFDSPGGDFEGAIEVGMILAENGIEVVVQNSPYENEEVKNSKNPLDTTLTELSDLPQCKKECGYAFLGGVLRNIEENAEFSITPLKAIKDLKSSKYTKTELNEIFSSFKISEELMEILETERKERSFTISEITKLGIENYSKKEFNWIYMKKGNVSSALKSIQLSEGRGRLVIAIKKDTARKPNEQMILEIMFKPLFEDKEFISALEELSLSVDDIDGPLWKTNALWNETNGVVGTRVILSDIENLQKYNELMLKVGLPNVYYAYRLDTSFFTDNVFEQIHKVK